jgi:hypothetical protein
MSCLLPRPTGVVTHHSRCSVCLCNVLEGQYNLRFPGIVSRVNRWFSWVNLSVFALFDLGCQARRCVEGQGPLLESHPLCTQPRDALSLDATHNPRDRFLVASAVLTSSTSCWP